MVCAQSTLEVNVPLRAAYDAWADVPGHRHFLTGVGRVEPVDEATWSIHGQGLGGQRRWTLRIAQQAEDEHVTMHTLDGPWDAMVVLFERLGPERTAVTLLRDHEPEGAVDPDLQTRVVADLNRFKRHVETASRDVEMAMPLMHGI